MNNQCVNFGVFFDGCFQFLFYDVTCCTRMVNGCYLFWFRPRLLILFSIESPMIMKFSRFLDLFSLHCSNGTSLSQLLFNSSKFLQLYRILSVLAGESWWFILLLASCFVKKLINICFSNSETWFVKILKQIYFSSELFSTDLTSRFSPMSWSSIARSLLSTDFTKSLNNFSTTSVFGVGFSTAGSSSAYSLFPKYNLKILVQ